MRLGDRRSVTDYAQQRLIDQNAWRRTSPCLVDFTTINDSKRRDGRGTDRSQLNTLWDKRTGDENRPLFNFCLGFEAWLTGGSASTAPASMLTAMRVVALANISVFTSDITPARPLCKF